MKGVILDADSLGPGDVDLSPVTDLLDEWDVHGFTELQDVTARIKDAAVVLSNKISLSRDVMSKSASLKLVSVMATGTNNVDLPAASEHGVTVCNAVGYATPSVVQHTMSLMLTLSNNLPGYVDDVRNGKWQQSNVFCLLDRPIVELSGKMLGIVGYGELGSGVANVAKAFGMDVLISARPGSDEVPTGRVAFDDLLAQVDYLSLHCPLTSETENLINKDSLAKMKPSAFLINTARGGLVHADDLINALEQNVITGAALDVVSVEPPGPDEPLTRAGLPNLIVTPHNAWGAIESRTRLVEQMRENIEAFLAGQPVRTVT